MYGAVLTNVCRYYKINRPDLISSEYTDANDASLRGTEALSLLHVARPTNSSMQNPIRVSDIVPVHADFLGAGFKQDWIVGISRSQNPEALMFRSDQSNPVYYIINVPGFDPESGASLGWTFNDGLGQDRIFFAKMNGNGIYEVDLSTVSLSGTTGTFTLRRIGAKSRSIGNYNDGLTCKVPTGVYPVLPFPT